MEIYGEGFGHAGIIRASPKAELALKLNDLNH